MKWWLLHFNLAHRRWDVLADVHCPAVYITFLVVRLRGLSSRAVSSKPLVSSEQEEFKISDSCAKRILSITDDKTFLRVLVEGGGCSGFQYKFELDTKVSSDDR